MMKSKWVGVAAAAVIVLGLGILIDRLRNPAADLSLELPEFVGEQLALQAEPLLEDGGKALIIMPDMPGAVDPYAAAYRRGFEAAMADRLPGVAVVDARITADPMRLQSGQPIFGPGELTRLIREHPDCGVFVSLAGLPDVSRKQRRDWKDDYPKLIVFAPLGGPAGALIDAGVAQAVIVPRDAGLDEEVVGDAVQARFDQDYVVLSR